MGKTILIILKKDDLIFDAKNYFQLKEFVNFLCFWQHFWVLEKLK